MDYITWVNADKHTQIPPESILANITNNLQISKTQQFLSLFDVSETVANVATAFLELTILMELRE